MASAYNHSTALQMAHLSSAAYCDSSVIKNWSCGPDCSAVSVAGPVLVSYLSDLNLQAYTVAMPNNEAAVVFRGTVASSIKDWILNLNVSKVQNYEKCSACGVEGGFLHGWRSLEPSILSNLKTLGFGPGSTLHVTGHSLGAAMATLAALELKGKGYRVATQYTFGQPRVGNAAFANLFQSTLGAAGQFRVTHYHDPVPHVPLVKMDFYHTTTEVWYNEANTQYTVCTGGESPTCADSTPWYDFWAVEDHLHYMGITIDGATCSLGGRKQYAADQGVIRLAPE